MFLFDNNHLFSHICFQVFASNINRYYPSADLGVISMKGYSTLSCVQELEPHQQMSVSYPGCLIWVYVYRPSTVG